jgi:tyrosyl-tRNA synthetase
MDLFGEFEWRGLVHSATDALRDVIAREKLTSYIGFDPTAASLHVGSLLPILCLARLQRFGHPPIAVVGGGTGMIGDPSGKTVERQLLSAEQVEANVEGIRSQLTRFLDFQSSNTPARVVNNAEWLTRLGAIEFMRDVGKHFTVNAMLAKESVKRRIESEEGITYTEFSYSLLQAYDFLKLFDDFNCTVQMGGSDQWGNIVAGIDLIRRRARRQGAWPCHSADYDSVGNEVRKDRGRGRLARCKADVAIPLLSVLVEYRRQRCGDVPSLLHVPRPSLDRATRRDDEDRRRKT